MNGKPGGPRFLTTHWTRVLAAQGTSPEAKSALRSLCEAYYAPVEAFIRLSTPHAARDLTHEFFAKILEGGAFDRLERGHGRFRSYLLGAVKHFLIDANDRERAKKRGGGLTILTMDAARQSEETGVSAPLADPKAFPPDAFFDREWALAVIGRALDDLRAEFDADGKPLEFETLKPWLTGAAGDAAEAAGRLNLSPSAFNVAVHRLRKRFRRLVKDDISRTLADNADLDAEMAYLIEALSYASTVDSK